MEKGEVGVVISKFVHQVEVVSAARRGEEGCDLFLSVAADGKRGGRAERDLRGLSENGPECD